MAMASRKRNWRVWDGCVESSDPPLRHPSWVLRGVLSRMGVTRNAQQLWSEVPSRSLHNDGPS
jgi:hypothetical protein